MKEVVTNVAANRRQPVQRISYNSKSTLKEGFVQLQIFTGQVRVDGGPILVHNFVQRTRAYGSPRGGSELVE